ncbi:hypothetical protein HMPREF9103_01644 [Lentilactobacillus parafarraginis F0439]|uniref:Uncharacterized protein n=1 Tax=Lentilactobacillus parafarraginis F0439 TaxID=797515 RepID=G9ZPJ0_9LACO|nr:hypothetical protein HMPREF9103_01644 [Lentilactobacillus parafarraginis F0439]
MNPLFLILVNYIATASGLFVTHFQTAINKLIMALKVSAVNAYEPARA